MSTYTPIATTTLTSTTALFTFAGIPQNYTDLILVVNDQYSQASGFSLNFNTRNYATPYYAQTSLLGYSGTANTGRTTFTTSFYNNLVFGSSITSGVYTPNIIHIQGYSNATTTKPIIWRYGTVDATGGGSGEVGMIAGTWNSTDQITSLSLYAFNYISSGAVFSIGTTFTLYGIASLGGVGSKATGGTVTTSGGYTYHAFTQSGMFVANQALTADILVVAGGGSGGACIGGNYESGGGGGAGGVLGFAAQSLTANTYPCIVGAGGAGVNSLRGNQGSNSKFGSLTTVVGGGGGAGSGVTASQSNAIAGGSGGGGSGYSSPTGYLGAAGISGQGFAGGNGTPNTAQGAGGGGGAGAIGSNASGETGGTGGTAVNTYTNATWLSTGLSVTGLGSSGYIAGGGGGGADAGYTPGGSGGGGAGAGKTDGSGAGNNAVANTGSGGGGQGGGSNGGNGGSGFIIVRYLT